MGSSWNPIDAVKDAIDSAIDLVTDIVQLKLDKAIGDAIRHGFAIHGISFSDEYKTITQVDSKMYNLLGDQKPSKLIVDATSRAIIFEKDILQCINEDLKNGGALRFRAYLNWAKRNSIYSKIGFNTTALMDYISETEILNAIKTVIGDVDYMSGSADIGNIVDLKFQIGLAYAIKLGYNPLDVTNCEILNSDTGEASIVLSDGSRKNFYVNQVDSRLRPNTQFATCIYKPVNYVYQYNSRIVPLSALPLKEELEIYTKTFTYGESGYSTYSVQDACSEIGIPIVFVQSFTFEEESHYEYPEPEEPIENPDNPDDDDENTEEPTEPVLVTTRTYRLEYAAIDYDSELFDNTQDVYITYNPDTLQVTEYRKELVAVSSSSYQSYWYEYGTGLPVVDALWTRAIGTTGNYAWAPILPVRSYTQPVTEPLFPEYYNVLVKSCKKLFIDSKFFPKLVNNINNNSQAAHIDFAHLMFGVALNRKEKYSIEYLCRFFIYISSYSSSFSTSSYAGTFNPRTEGRKVILYDTQYGKKLGYWCSVPDGITAELNWNLIWDSCYYDTFFADKTPANKCWIETKTLPSGSYRLSGNTANLAVGYIVDGSTCYVFYMTDAVLDTSLFTMNGSPLCKNNTWVNAGKLNYTNWHICSDTEMSYFRNTYGISSNPVDYLNLTSTTKSYFKKRNNAVYIASVSSDYDDSDSIFWWFMGSNPRTLREELRTRLGWNQRYGSSCRFSSNTNKSILYTTTYRQEEVWRKDSDGSNYQTTVTVAYPYSGCNVTFSSVGSPVTELSICGIRQLRTVNGIVPLPSGTQLVFNRRISGTYCERAYVSNLRIQNTIIPGFAIVYKATDYLNSTDGSNGTCPFIIPINYTVFKQMSLLHQNEVLQVSYNLLINIFVKENIRIPWYGTKAFKTVCLIGMVVVMVIVTIFSWGSATGPALVAMQTAYGVVAGTALFILVKLAIAIAVKIVMTLISKIVMSMTNNPYIAQAVSMVAALVAAYALNAWSDNIMMGADATSSVFTNIANNVMNYISNPRNIASLAMDGIKFTVNKLNQSVQGDYLALQNEQQEFMKQYQKAQQNLYDATVQLNSAKNSSFAERFSYLAITNPYHGIEYGLSSANPKTTYELSQSKVYNMYEITINVKNYV